MKNKMLVSIAAVLLLVAAGCETMGPKTKTGAVAGGLLGAAAGGIIGHQSGHGLEGAGIGAAIGALSGGLVGSSMDDLDKRAKAANPDHLAITAIVDMAVKGVPDDVIISEIERTHSVYTLTSEVITYLKQNKVSDKVVDFMLATSR